MFDDQRVKEILETPIGLPSTADKRVWMGNKSGDYSVKSGYIHTRNQTTNTLHTNNIFLSPNKARPLEIYLAIEYSSSR